MSKQILVISTSPRKGGNSDTMTINGSLNQSVEDHIDYTENIVEIQGGNHAQFGNYGPQKGDLPVTVSA